MNACGVHSNFRSGYLDVRGARRGEDRDDIVPQEHEFELARRWDVLFHAAQRYGLLPLGIP